MTRETRAITVCVLATVLFFAVAWFWGLPR